jgi:hypothetical protein
MQSHNSRTASGIAHSTPMRCRNLNFLERKKKTALRFESQRGPASKQLLLTTETEKRKANTRLF